MILNHPSHYELFWADEPLFTALGAGVLSLLISFTALDKVTQKTSQLLALPPLKVRQGEVNGSLHNAHLRPKVIT